MLCRFLLEREYKVMQSENKAENGSPLKLRNCFEELVKFTLHSHLNDALDFQHLGLSREFCSTLLKDYPTDPSSDDTDSLDGFPPYPLYKRLASALLKCLTSEVPCGTCNHLTMIHENSSMQQKQNEWQKLIVEKGSKIVKILKSVSFELDVEESFFSHLKDGLKTI